MIQEQLPKISVIDPVGPAIGKVKAVLFKPFELGKWFTIGFCAWLAYLGKSGFSFNFPFRKRHHNFQPDQVFHNAKNFITENLPWVVLFASIFLVLVIVLWLAFTWLRSRGDFMFLHCVAENKAEVKIPWHKFQRHANSVFLFRIIVGLIAFVVNGLLCVAATFLLLMLASNIGLSIVVVPGFILACLVIAAAVIAFILVYKFTTDFVVPIMFLRTTSCTDAWRQFLAILSTNKPRFALYILFQIVIFLCICLIILAAVCITCCCAACIFTIPYIGTVFLLPLFVFKRAYSLCFFRQFGREFDVFTPQVETT